MEPQMIRQCVVAAVLSLSVASCDAGGMKNMEAGLRVGDHASAADVGLPAYPGAKPYVEGSDDSHSANVDISTPLFGVNVVAVELETSDEPDKVAAFYRRALAKYGQVLDCGDGVGARSESSAASDVELECSTGDSESHDLVYKAGTEDNHRMVAIRPHGTGTQFSLVHIDLRHDSSQ